MKVNKKILTLILGTSVIFSVGCSKANKGKEVIVNSSVHSENSVVEGNNNEINNSEELNNEANNELSEEEALKLVENELKDIYPGSKFKVQGREFVGNEDSYVIEYDVPFDTVLEFIVNISTKEVTVLEHDYYQFSISELKRRVSVRTQDTPISLEEAKSNYIRIQKHNNIEHPDFSLSDNQLNNLELAAEHIVGVSTGNNCWVLKYPMEKNQQWYNESECTRDNAKSIDDKYGYVYLDPYYKWFIESLHSDEHGDLHYVFN